MSKKEKFKRLSEIVELLEVAIKNLKIQKKPYANWENMLQKIKSYLEKNGEDEEVLDVLILLILALIEYIKKLEVSLPAREATEQNRTLTPGNGKDNSPSPPKDRVFSR